MVDKAKLKTELTKLLGLLTPPEDRKANLFSMYRCAQTLTYSQGMSAKVIVLQLLEDLKEDDSRDAREKNVYGITVLHTEDEPRLWDVLMTNPAPATLLKEVSEALARIQARCSVRLLRIEAIDFKRVFNEREGHIGLQAPITRHKGKTNICTKVGTAIQIAWVRAGEQLLVRAGVARKPTFADKAMLPFGFLTEQLNGAMVIESALDTRERRQQRYAAKVEKSTVGQRGITL